MKTNLTDYQKELIEKILAMEKIVVEYKVKSKPENIK